MDSLIVINILNHSFHPSAAILYLVRKIYPLLTSLNWQLTHIYREGNMAADWLAKRGSRIPQVEEFIESNAPVELLFTLQQDKNSTSYSRIWNSGLMFLLLLFLFCLSGLGPAFCVYFILYYGYYMILIIGMGLGAMMCSPNQISAGIL